MLKLVCWYSSRPLLGPINHSPSFYFLSLFIVWFHWIERNTKLLLLIYTHNKHVKTQTKTLYLYISFLWKIYVLSFNRCEERWQKFWSHILRIKSSNCCFFVGCDVKLWPAMYLYRCPEFIISRAPDKVQIKLTTKYVFLNLLE